MTPRSALAGRTILVTRPVDRSERLVDLLERTGATVIAAPAIELKAVRSAELSRALRDLAAGGFAWVVLTSPATVRMLDERLEGGGDVRAKVASLGEGTSAAYERWSGRRSDLLPRSFTTEGLARAFPRGEGRVLCARADIAPDGLEDALTAKGWTPTRVDAYRTVFPNTLPRAATAALAEGTIDAITFTSASTVRGFLNALGTTTVAGKPKIVCIGPVTARQARDAGLPVHAVADPHTTDGLITALERALRPRRRAGRG